MVVLMQDDGTSCTFIVILRKNRRIIFCAKVFYVERDIKPVDTRGRASYERVNMSLREVSRAVRAERRGNLCAIGWQWL